MQRMKQLHQRQNRREEWQRVEQRSCVLRVSAVQRASQTAGQGSMRTLSEEKESGAVFTSEWCRASYMMGLRLRLSGRGGAAAARGEVASAGTGSGCVRG